MEAEELSNSILIEISKSSVTAWHEKLHNRYGWFKSENCKNIIFEVQNIWNNLVKSTIWIKSMINDHTIG